MYIAISYENIKGGVNNMQVARVMRGYSTIKTFWSINHQAEARARRWLKKNEKPCEVCGSENCHRYECVPC